MKKIVVCAALVLLAATAAFAAPPLQLSAGAGVLFASDFGGGLKADPPSFIASLVTLDDVNTPWYGGGGYAFFDATYAEASVSFIYGSGTYDMSGSNTGKYSLINLGLSILGKYPFVFGKLSAFPLVGIEYRLALSAKDEDGEAMADSTGGKAGDLSALWFQFGGGVDYALTDALYLRGSLLYGIRLASKFEKDLDDLMKAAAGGFDCYDPKQGHGLTVKAAIGYKF